MSILKRILKLIGIRPKPYPRTYELSESLQVTLKTLAEHEGCSEGELIYSVPPTKRQKSVFLIYAHADREAVRKLYQRMVRDGIHVWWDAEKLEAGQNWQAEIRNSLFKSDVVLVCLSENFNEERGYRYEELNIALEKARFTPSDEIFIIPIRLEKCDMPESLRHLHRLDLFEPDGYRKVIQALQEHDQ